MPASALPAPLREIGFDQNLDRAACRSTSPFRDEAGRTVRLGDYFGKRPVVLAFVYYDCPMLCTQVLNGAVERARRAVARRRARTSRSSPSASIRARRRRLRRREEGGVPASATSGPAPTAAWHFLTGDQPSIDRADEGRRLPLRLGRRDEAVRASDRHHRADAGRPAGALSVRHRVRPARSAVRASSRRRPGKIGSAGRLAAALLLSLRPDDRPLRPRRSCARCASPAPPPCSRSARSSSSWSAASGTRDRSPERTARLSLEDEADADVVRHSALPRAGVDDGRPRRRAVLLPARGRRPSSRC